MGSIGCSASILHGHNPVTSRCLSDRPTFDSRQRYPTLLQPLSRPTCGHVQVRRMAPPNDIALRHRPTAYGQGQHQRPIALMGPILAFFCAELTRPSAPNSADVVCWFSQSRAQIRRRLGRPGGLSAKSRCALLIPPGQRVHALARVPFQARPLRRNRRFRYRQPLWVGVPGCLPPPSAGVSA